MGKKDYKYYDLNNYDYDAESEDSRSVLSDDSYDSEDSFESYSSTYSDDSFETSQCELVAPHLNCKKVNKIDTIHPKPIDFIVILREVPFTYLTNLKTGEKIKQKNDRKLSY